MNAYTCQVCEIKTEELLHIWLNYNESDSGPHNLRSVCPLCHAYHHNHNTPLNRQPAIKQKPDRPTPPEQINQYTPPPETKP